MIWVHGRRQLRYSVRKRFQLNQEACPKCVVISEGKQYICPYCWTKLRLLGDKDDLIELGRLLIPTSHLTT